MEIAPGTIAVFADIGCPWAHLAVYRLHDARRSLGLEDRVRLDIRAFPLEIFNEQATPKQILDMEVPVAGASGPEASWQAWQGAEHEYPVTMLPPMEAVEAAKEQGLQASEQLDRALRVAFFGQSRTVSLRHVIRDVAEGCPDVDTAKLLEALDDGRARGALMRHIATAQGDEVGGSPHLFLPDGTNVHNPGIEFHWEGEHGKGFPVVDSDEPEIYTDLLQRAVGG